MNPAHLHVVLNHIPVIGIPFGAALMVYGFIRKNEEVKRVSLLAFIIVALITIPTYLAGQAAEDMVEHLPGVSENTIETHEEAATVGLIVTSILGVLALAGLALSVIRGSLGFLPTILFIVLAFAVSGWLGRVANLGGKIRHPEFSDGAVVDDDDDEREKERGRDRDRAVNATDDAEPAREDDRDRDEGGQRRRRNRGGRNR